MSSDLDRASEVLDELAAKAKPSDLDKLDDDFEERLERLERQQKLDGRTANQLHVMWRMLKASDAVVPWPQKTVIMAALAYFAAPFDLFPDFAGKKGYADDAFVIRLAYERLGALTSQFE